MYNHFISSIESEANDVSNVLLKDASFTFGVSAPAIPVLTEMIYTFAISPPIIPIIPELTFTFGAYIQVDITPQALSGLSYATNLTKKESIIFNQY